MNLYSVLRDGMSPLYLCRYLCLLRMNRDAKEKLEMDWSDKVEAYDMDDKCGRYSNQSTDIQFHHNSSKLEDK